MVDVLPESRNVIPDRVTVAIDWRILPGDTDESLIGRVQAAIARRVPEVPERLGIEVRMGVETQTTYTGLVEDKNLLTPGFLMDPEAPIVLAAAEAVGRRDGDGPATIRPWMFATDGGWSCGVHGIPTVGFAPGQEEYAHTNRERMAVADAEWGLERYPHLIEAIQRAVS